MTVPQISQDEAQDVSDLIADIYDAALDPALWPGALRKVRTFVRGAAAGVFAKDAAEKSGGLFYDDGGIKPEFVQLYFDKYIKFDPATTRHFFAKLEEPYGTADLMDYKEFTESRFYQEWARPQGLVDFVTAVVDKTTTSVTMFGVFRHERDGLADDESRRRVKLLAPHIRRAVLIDRVIELKSAQAATFADTLDGLNAGMFLVDASGRIVHANASGLAMLETADFLRETNGRLEAGDAATEATLKEIISAAGGGDAAIGIKGVAVPLNARDGARYLAHILPLTSGARRRTGRSYAAVAAIFVHKAGLDTPSPPEIIAKTYKLTPTELRVLLGIVEVGGVPEVAEALGIGETTVKTHLGRLYEKTGARRQVDLVKLVAGFTHPLAG
jgi:DNA-binding CsgD family transcriptional regulator